MLPILTLCHNLTVAGDDQTAAFFRHTILPPPTSPTPSRAAFLFKHLQFFLTCLDTDVKRFTGEWLFLLCDQNGACFLLVLASSVVSYPHILSQPRNTRGARE